MLLLAFHDIRNRGCAKSVGRWDGAMISGGPSRCEAELLAMS